tara:strand:- start:208 stop:798 length:591 start_codon:yes stop_codon:yes gene_type:complete
MPLPIVYRGGGDFTVQLTWIERMSNIGYVRFYANAETDNGGVGYYLATSATDAQPPKTDSNVDINFDWEFKVPATVAANNCIINVTVHAQNTVNTTLTYTIYHYDGATETSLGTATGAAHLGAAADEDWRDNIKIALTQKHFKVGDILRLNIVVAGDDFATKWFYHDAGTALTVAVDNGRTCGTDLTCDIPFKVQI